MDRRVLSFGLAAVIVVLDRLTKWWVESYLDLWDSINVIPGFFNLVHIQNRGMVFGLMSDSPGPWRTVLLIGVAGVVLVLVAIMIWTMPKHLARHQRLTPLCLGLILGGAIGNLYDRIIRRSVTDFLDFYIGDYHWYVFNIADSAITVGAILMALELLRAPQPAKET